MLKIPIWMAVIFIAFAQGRTSWAHTLSLKDSSLAPEGHPILKKKSLPVDDKYFSSGELKQFAAALAKEMFSHFGIIGIAAPQRSIGLRMFLMRSSSINPFDRSYDVFINPVLTPLGDSMGSSIEFCLSISGFYWVKRYKRIQLEFFELDGTRKVIELTGSRARAAQHEIDHLDGKLLSDE